MEPIDPEDLKAVARAFGVAEALAAEVMDLNDEYAADDYIWVDVEVCGPLRPDYPERPIMAVRVRNERAAEERWRYMRAWVAKNLKTPRRELMKLTMWLKERELNARRLATGKTGELRAGWLEDADHLQAALAAVEERDLLRAALAESVKLQSHYAVLLNMHDGGQRMAFSDAEAWLERLRFLKPNAEHEPPRSGRLDGPVGPEGK